MINYLVDSKARADINDITKQLAPKKYPVPATITPTIYRYQNSTYTINCIDDDGAIWAMKWDFKVCKSIDEGATFVPVLDFASSLNNGETLLLQALVISDTGRIIVSTDKGRILVSNEEQTTISEAFTFKAGSTKLTWGWAKEGQYIVMAAYGDKTAANPPREVYLSKNDGETWDCIFDKPIDEMIDASDYHLHDVTIDPYSNMIMLIAGDSVNRQIHYTYDWGITWYNVFDESEFVSPNIPPIHPTSLVCFPDGIAMGSDELPEGIYWWNRPTGVSQPTIRWEDIEYKVIFGKATDTIIGTLANKGHALHTSTGDYGVIPFRNQETVTQGNARLYVTGDGGKSWYEIYIESIWDSNHKGFYNAILKENADKTITIFGTYAIAGTTSIFKATMPNFRSFTNSDVEQQIVNIKTDWQEWTPTIEWTTATPTTVTTLARDRTIDKAVFFDITITSTDGNGATAPVYISLPILPKNQNTFPLVNAVQLVGTTPTILYAYVRDDGTNNDLCVMIDTATDGSVLTVKVSGFYEIA